MLRNSQKTYGLVAIVLHWMIALAIIAQVIGGLTMIQIQSKALQFTIIQWHKSTGLLILALAVLRILWHFVSIQPKQIESVPPLEQTAARVVQWTLMAATIIVPLSGWAIASSSPLKVPTYFFNLVVIPHLPLEVSESSETVWSVMHGFFVFLTVGLVAGHAGAALRHHLVLRNAVLARMLNIQPPTPLNERESERRDHG